LLLKDWPACSRLALQLSVQTRARRSSDLVRGLRNRLIAHSRSVVEYPSAPSSTDQDQLGQTVGAWLERRLGDIRVAGKKGKANTPDLDWARWAAVCLMEDPLIVRTEGIYRLLEAFCLRHPGSDMGEAEALFFREVGRLLDGEKANTQRLA